MTAEKHEACVVCGLDLENDEYRINRYEGGKLLARFCGEYCNGRYDERATSPVLQSASEPQELKEALKDLSRARGPDQWDDAVSRIVALFAKQREEIERLGAFSRTAYLSANRELEAKLAASYLAIERRDAQIASLQSGKDSSFEELITDHEHAVMKMWAAPVDRMEEAKANTATARAALSRYVAQQREEIVDLRSHVVGLVSEVQQWKDALQSEIERQRETTLTPEEAQMIDDALDGTNGQVWAQVVAKLRRIASSSPLT